MKKIILIILVLLAIGQTAQTAHSQEYTLLEPLPALDGSGNLEQTIELDTYIEYVFKFSIALAVFLAVIMIIWGGFEYVLSEIPFVKTNAKSRIFNAVMGLIGALVSYLVLLTIDPRLVQINTRLEPINIDVTEILEFRNSLANDLATLNAEALANVTTQQKTLESLLEQRRNLAFECEEGIRDDEDYCMREIAKLDSKIRETRTSMYKSVTDSIGLSNFNTAFNILNDPANYSESATYLESGTRRTFLVPNSKLSDDLSDNINEAKNTIKNKYNEYIDKIEGDDPATAQLLEKQRDFYISEIENERVVNGYIISYKNSNVVLDGNMAAYRKLAKSSIENEIEKYEAEYNNPQKGTAVGLENEYKNMVSKRIALLKKALDENTDVNQ